MITLAPTYTDSMSLLDDAAALRARADEDGLLFFRGLLPRDLVLELRAQFLQILANRGWLKGNPTDALADKEAIEREDPAAMIAQGVGFHNEAYAEVQKLELFHALAHHPNLIRVYETLFQTAVLPHPRHIARLMLPASFNSPTPPHQDFIHIQGTKNVWTAWVPIGDCPRTMGGLTAIKGGHKEGLLPVAAAQGAGGLESHLCAKGYVWLEEDFLAGDLLTFSSLTVHKALKPQDTDHVRLSCDFRYQPANEDIEQASLLPHGQVTTWEEIYKDWKSTRYQYYWKNKQLKMSEWDESIRWQKEKIC
jgi:ectoine hydroxylase-related dioxygenase (phytanoyl-CoA dioxygenase family)